LWVVTLKLTMPKFMIEPLENALKGSMEKLKDMFVNKFRSNNNEDQEVQAA